MGRWKRPKEVWEERICVFCKPGAIEIEWHFLSECTAYDNIQTYYDFIQKVVNMHSLFEVDRIKQTTDFLIKIHIKRLEMERNMESV